MENEKQLIDLDVAKQATHKEIWWTESQQAAVRSFLVKLPRVDAVEVVRCKDCKHWCKDALWCNINSAQCTEQHYNWYAEDFCSYGAKMDGDGNG